MKSYPIMLNITGKICTVVGGGSVAFRKAKTLFDCGGIVRVISPCFVSEFDSMDLEYIQKPFSPSLIDDSFLVIACTDDEKLNCDIILLCKEKGILSSSVNGGKEMDFHVPSMISEENLCIAVSTNGAFPKLGIYICNEVKDRYKNYEKASMILSNYRKKVLSSGKVRKQINDFLDVCISPTVIDYIEKGQFTELDSYLKKQYELKIDRQ